MRKRFEFRVEVPTQKDKEYVENALQQIITKEGYSGKHDARSQALAYMARIVHAHLTIVK